MNVLSFDKGNLPDAIDDSLDVLMAEAYGCDPGPYKNLVTLDEDENVVGHLAAYTREAEIEGEALLVGLIGNVATKRTHRKQGIAKALVSAAHEQFRGQSIAFSVLFAYEPKVYRSSGYKRIKNKLRFYGEGKWQNSKVSGSMYCALADKPWPDAVIDLKGPLV